MPPYRAMTFVAVQLAPSTATTLTAPQAAAGALAVRLASPFESALTVASCCAPETGTDRPAQAPFGMKVEPTPPRAKTTAPFGVMFDTEAVMEPGQVPEIARVGPVGAE